MAQHVVEVDVSGPIFDGRAQHAITDFLGEAQYEVAAQGYAEVMTTLNASIKHPTPYYETQVTQQRFSPTLIKVHDRDVIYGPWLEGVSPRNRSTRFKGYHSFRRAYLTLTTKAPAIIQHTLDRYLRRMG